MNKVENKVLFVSPFCVKRDGGNWMDLSVTLVRRSRACFVKRLRVWHFGSHVFMYTHTGKKLCIIWKSAETSFPTLSIFRSAVKRQFSWMDEASQNSPQWPFNSYVRCVGDREKLGNAFHFRGERRCKNGNCGNEGLGFSRKLQKNSNLLPLA